MTNDEKIKELICKHCKNHTKTEECTLDTGCRQYSNLLKMAKWKDAQIAERSVDLDYLISWYISSIDETVPPIWTDEHLEELLKDFYLIPKSND